MITLKCHFTAGTKIHDAVEQSLRVAKKLDVTIEMEYGKIKVGDVVKFNAKAKKEIASAIDNREHIVEKVDIYSDGTEYVDFEDGSRADVYWLTRVRGEK